MLETNVHFPTDVSLLYDSGRKCLDTLAHLREKGIILEGARQCQAWNRKLRNRSRAVSKIMGKGGGNYQARLRMACLKYLEVARNLEEKVGLAHQSLIHLADPLLATFCQDLGYFLSMLSKHIDLVDRRIIQGETIPHKEKVFSIFENYTEWITKGKSHPKFELGLNVLVASDQYQFILHHQVVEHQADVELAVSTAQQICHKYKRDKLKSISFDRAFYSGPNYQNLQKYVDHVILPKKGSPNPAEALRESDPHFVALQHKHSAVEANINQLEHHGLNKCPDKGLKRFKQYAALGVLAYNLHRLGKILLDQEREAHKKAKRRRLPLAA